MFAATRQTRAEAWLAAAEALYQARARLYNVVLEIESPGMATPASRAIEAELDAFLRKHHAQPNHTVAETIFPAFEYRQGGISAVYKYPTSVYPFIRDENRWGTYALRLTERKCSDGTVMSPLEIVIDKLKRQLSTTSPKRAVYELDLGLEALDLKFYSAEDDNNNNRGGQCLSHVSLKLGPNGELYMTALYRYQFYVQKAVGNLLGLARLQSAIANEVGIPVGPLVCHATMAMLEDRQLDSSAPWRHAELGDLLDKCKAIRDNGVEVAA
jgi:hypothetical protein